METAAITDAVDALRADARLDGTASPSRLWPSMITAWTGRLDRRIEDDLGRLDRAGAQKDLRSASRG
jgi:hypothetical protein